MEIRISDKNDLAFDILNGFNQSEWWSDAGADTEHGFVAYFRMDLSINVGGSK